VDSLDRLFSELLNLSQLDAGVLQPQWVDFPLDRLFDEISRNFRPVAEQQGLRLVARKTDLWVRCDYVMLSRILNNLVSNSLASWCRSLSPSLVTAIGLSPKMGECSLSATLSSGAQCRVHSAQARRWRPP